MHGDEGACYGLESSVQRYTCNELQPKTPIENFYLTGVDIAFPGVAGGLMSGIMTARTIVPNITKLLIPGKRDEWLKD